MKSQLPEGIESLADKVTMIIIAHLLATISDCDRIYLTINFLPYKKTNEMIV